jgi:integral membrane sensor domain MASE1
MPPRWPRQPTRLDPAFRKLDDRMNFAVHVAIFAATNSGIWFVRTLQSAPWDWTVWFTGIWAVALVIHAIIIFAIADYSDRQSHSSSQNG